MRNVNQGQRGHPSTSDILAGFADAGCPDAVTFQSNGTILFDSRSPRTVVEAAAEAIAARSGQAREVFWIPLSDVSAVVEKHGAASEPRRFEFTLHSGGALDLDDADVEAEADRNRCEIVDAGSGWALVRNSVEGEGHATPVLESLTGGRATSRGLPTLVRLVDRFGS
jgi:uncharacterized protein (DUF1697 family)